MLELLDLAVGLDDVVLQGSHGAFGVLVGDLLGLGVNLLLALTLATFKIHEGNHVALGGEACFLDGAIVKQHGGAEHESVN